MRTPKIVNHGVRLGQVYFPFSEVPCLTSLKRIKEHARKSRAQQTVASDFGGFFSRSTDEALTSLAEFLVQKISVRSPDPTRRTVCLTETCLVERDPATYNVVTCKPLCDVSRFGTVRVSL